MTIPLPLTQGSATLALGYFRRLPPGAERLAAHGMTDLEVHLELLAGRGIICRVPPVSILGSGITAKRALTQASTFNPCFSTMSNNLRAMPLGFFAPLSHFSMVDSLVLR